MSDIDGAAIEEDGGAEAPGGGAAAGRTGAGPELYGVKPGPPGFGPGMPIAFPPDGLAGCAHAGAAIASAATIAALVKRCFILWSSLSVRDWTYLSRAVS